jgi:hypothetical protein
MLANAQQTAAEGGFPLGRSEDKNSSSISTPEQTFELLPGGDPNNRLVSPFLAHLAEDQKQFWTSPARLRKKDLRWIVPFGGMTATLIAGDSWLSKQVPDKPSQLDRSLKISDYSTYALIGAGGGAFLLGHMTRNDHMSETGLLAGEAAINSTAVTYLFKTATQRPRPQQDNGNGTFFQGGASFTSEHSAIAWSIASVMAHEYPGPLTQLMAYGLASAVTLTRVTAKQHFPSDAVVGSVLGWYFGRQIYRAHHDHELGGTAWGNFYDDPAERGPRDPRNMGSPYVALDSWVYPAFDRLAAMGYLKSAYTGQRPWTRLECARLLEEAGEQIPDSEATQNDVAALYRELLQEFSQETANLNGAQNLDVALDSVYTRVTGISGPPLRDSYHFAQTIVNDYGRPYAEGLNNVTGVTAHAVAGPLFFDFQGEYQHAPATSSYPTNVMQAIANVDFALPFSNATTAIDRFRILNASAGFTFNNVNFSFGNQSLSLGPSNAGSLLLSDNASPIPMLRINSASPYWIPGLSRILGPIRTDYFLGQLSGHTFVFANTHLVGPYIDPQPYIHGAKISFKPTPNLEVGMGITAMFGGPGLPFTWHNFLRTYYAHSPDISQNPGKRTSAADLSYRIPGVRNWATFYLDSMVVDEVSPIGSGRPSINPGIYFPRLPRIPKLELRFEGVDTEHHAHEFTPGFVYADRRYKSGYTNDGLIMGNWVGRDGIGVLGWATYHFSARNQLQVGYRHAEVDRDFLQGGHYNDYSIQSNWVLRSGLGFSGFLQYERWAFPLLAPTPKSNVTASVQITFWPKWSAHSRTTH